MTWMLLSLACGSGARPELVVGQPWVRMMPPGAPNTAGFMSLTSPVDDALIGASAGISGAVELHTHAEQGGMMRMRKVDRVELPAGQLVELKAGGNHLMFIGLKASLTEGQQVPVTLQLASGGTVELSAPVRAE
jgi:copper(I)-binding protein